MTKREHLEASLRKEMESAGVDALIAVSPENVQHLTGAYIISQRMIPDRLRLRSAANADRAFRAGRDRGAPRRHHAA